jgi:hypothetical protein
LHHYSGGEDKKDKKDRLASFLRAGGSQYSDGIAVV